MSLDTITNLLPHEAQLVASLALFALVALVKRVPSVARWLSTPRRKQLAVALTATAAVLVIGWGQAPPRELAAGAVTIFLAAMGWNALRPSKSKPNSA